MPETSLLAGGIRQPRACVGMFYRGNPKQQLSPRQLRRTLLNSLIICLLQPRLPLGSPHRLYRARGADCSGTELIPGKVQMILMSRAEDQRVSMEAWVGRACLPWLTMDTRYLEQFLATPGI